MSTTRHSPSSFLVVAFDNERVDLCDTSDNLSPDKRSLKTTSNLEEHLARYPAFTDSLRSRLFSYTPNIGVLPLQTFYRTFGFSRFKGSNPSFKEIYSPETVDYQTYLENVPCQCGKCCAGSKCGLELFDATFGVCVMQVVKPLDKKASYSFLRKVGLSNTAKPRREGFLYCGDTLTFPELDSIEFKLTLVRIKMLCCRDEGGPSGVQEAFHCGQTLLEEMHSEPISYVIEQVKCLTKSWNDTIRLCRSILSDLNRAVLEDGEDEIDRKLVRKLFKYAQTWEQLRRVHQQQLEALGRIVSNDSEKAVWFGIDSVHSESTAAPEALERPTGVKNLEDMKNLLKELTELGENIKVQLVGETRELITRTNSIISIDEAYRSRDQNASINRLSWITFIFLPALFVASLFGMNIDILKDNKAPWWSWFWLWIPAFALILFSVCILKYWKEWKAELSLFLRQRKMRAESKIYDVENQLESGSGDELRNRQIIWAAECGDQKSVEALLRRVVFAGKMESVGYMALQAAAGGGHHTIVEILLSKGADVNAAVGGGRTALQAAAGGGHQTVVEILLNKGADVNAAPAEDDGRTVLQAAAGGGHQTVVEILLSKGADVNAAPVEWYGRTALQAAAGEGHQTVVEILLSKGADVNAAPAEWYGRTALQAARENNHQAIIDLLVGHGAKN